MSKCAECTSWTITGVLYIVTFGRFVDFRMKLLFCPRMAILAGITGLAADGVAPLVSRLDIGTGSGSKSEMASNFRPYFGKAKFSTMTSCAFVHCDSFSIGLRHGFPTPEREYDWMWSE